MTNETNANPESHRRAWQVTVPILVVSLLDIVYLGVGLLASVVAYALLRRSFDPKEDAFARSAVSFVVLLFVGLILAHVSFVSLALLSDPLAVVEVAGVAAIVHVLAVVGWGLRRVGRTEANPPGWLPLLIPPYGGFPPADAGFRGGLDAGSKHDPAPSASAGDERSEAQTAVETPQDAPGGDGPGSADDDERPSART